MPAGSGCVPALAALGASIGNSRIIQIKGSWNESATIYGAVIADSGERKSAAVAAALSPLYKAQRRMHREYEDLLAIHADQTRAYNADKQRQKEEPPPEPTAGFVVVDDTTREALVPILRDNPRGVLQAKDEVIALVKSFNAYRNGAGEDRQFWLSCWSNRPHSVTRVGRRPLWVHRPFVGVIGSLQPTVLPELRGNRDDGLLERFLICYPDPLNAGYTDAEITAAARSGYEDAHDKLRSMGMGTDDQGDPMPVPVTFSTEAKEAWIDAYDDHREEMTAPWFQPQLRAAWSKLEGYMLRLTLICACCRFSLDGTAQRIEVDDVLRAVRLTDYFKSHARRAHAALKDEDASRALLEIVQAFLLDQGGKWEGEPSKLCTALKDYGHPPPPSGLTPRLNRLAKDYSEAFGCENGQKWDSDKQNARRTLKISLPNTGVKA